MKDVLPLKQGLKLGISHSTGKTMANERCSSIKTRIETTVCNITCSFDVAMKDVLPLKQGLKLS